MRNHSTDHRVIPPLYGDQDMPEETVAECVTYKQKCYIAKWADTCILESRVHLHAQTGYLPERIEICLDIGRIYGPVGQKTAKVSWKEKAESVDNADFSQTFPAVRIAACQAKKAALGHIRLGKDVGHRKDTAENNLQRQGHWADLQDKVSSALLHEPELGCFIDINPLDVVNPDHDIVAPGRCTIRTRERCQSENNAQLA